MEDNTHCIGPLYWTSIDYATRRLDTAWTNEVTPPFRHGWGLSLKLRGPHGVVVGFWWRRRRATEEGGLLSALRGGYIHASPEEIGVWQGEGFDEDPEVVRPAC